MAKSLTKLQRLGISTLLRNYSINNQFTGKRLYEGGKITFVHNIHGNWYNMFVYVKELVHIDESHDQLRYKNIIVLTLEESENIDTNIEYQYMFDPKDLLFHIVEIEK